MPSLYETDYYGWTQHVAAALRERRIESLNLDEIAEEIEDLGRSERRSLRSALKQLLQHLLKWDYQAERRSRSWVESIKKHRVLIDEIIEENPSLRRYLSDHRFVATAYELALIDAILETNLDRSEFPQTYLYTLEDLLTGERAIS